MKKQERKKIHEEVRDALTKRLRGRTLTTSEAYKLSMMVLREINFVTQPWKEDE